MDAWISITKGQVGARPSGVVNHVSNHLWSTQESDCPVHCLCYLATHPDDGNSSPEEEED